MNISFFGLFQLSGEEQPRHSPQTPEPTHRQGSPFHRDIGPIGTLVRLITGLLFIGFIVYGQLVATRHFTPAAWALGLLGFPALAFTWHWQRIRRHPSPFRDTGTLSSLLSFVLPLAVYLTGWAVPILGFISDATLLFLGFSLLFAALRGAAGCEFLSLSNWLLRRSDQLACAVFTPIDAWEQRGSRRETSGEALRVTLGKHSGKQARGSRRGSRSRGEKTARNDRRGGHQRSDA